MTVALMIIAGLALGSFVNALVWRIRILEKTKSKAKRKKLSPLTGRSMCTHCEHVLAAKDLLPVVSWLSLKGKCRYCKKPIHWQYPLVELLTAALFAASYLLWPFTLSGLAAWTAFSVWLAILTLLAALLVYDLKWMELPDNLVAWVTMLSVAFVALNVIDGSVDFYPAAIGGLLLGGLFYVLFQVSKGAWIGGGDVKLAPALGLLAGSPLKAILLLFIASFIGTLIGLPLIAKHGRKKRLKLPFGPLLIVGLLVVVFFGQGIIDWYINDMLYL